MPRRILQGEKGDAFGPFRGRIADVRSAGVLPAVLPEAAIHPIYHPQRWLGYIATVFLVYGSVEILAGRIRKKEEIHNHSEFCDYSLPVLILLSAATGIAVHVFRYSGLAFAAHYAYLVHLVVSVPILVVELPFGKLSHMAYRPLAVYLQAVKDKAVSLQVTEETREAA